MVRMPVAPGPERRDPRRGRGAQPAAAQRAATTRRGGWSSASIASWIRRQRGRSTTSTTGDELLIREKRHAARRAARTAVDLQVRRAHRAGRFGQVAGDQGARGPRLLLRRQPAGRAAADARRPDACAPAARSPAPRSSSTSAKARCSRSSRASTRRLQQKRSLNPVLIFLEARSRRWCGDSARRGGRTRSRRDRSALEGIREEKQGARSRVREMADHVVDTSEMTVHELRHAFTGVARRSRAGHSSWWSRPELRLQARHPGRLRSAVRRPLPAEPALRPGAAAPYGTRRGSRRATSTSRRRRTSS